MEGVREEICLVATIIDRLLAANEVLRADQLAPLTARLRAAANDLSHINEQSRNSAAHSPVSKVREAIDIAGTGLRPSFPKTSHHKLYIQQTPSLKLSGKGRRVASAQKDSGESTLFISKEVSQSICCSLYNVLEGTTRLLQASHAHIFVKRGDDMFAIANVGRKLVFPPTQVHHRCIGNSDAEVLGSSIALNRYVDEVGRKNALLIFPIYQRNIPDEASPEPIATIHVERKEHVFAAFNENDELILQYAAVICGELLSRIPQLNFLEVFYNPTTQHIVAPFEPYKAPTLPAIQRPEKVSQDIQRMPFSGKDDYSTRALKQVTKKLESHRPEVLIRRERLPSNNRKPFAPGVPHMPTLLEIQAYVESLQSCWKKNLTDNVELLEADRGTQQDLREARSQLASTRCQLAAVSEKLRLYELEGADYKGEYGAMKSELKTYMDGLERLH